MEENIHDIIYIVNPSGKILFISDAIQQYGYSPSELIGTNIIGIIHPRDRKKIASIIDENRSEKEKMQRYEIWLITKNKTVVPMEIKSKGIVENISISTLATEGFCVATFSGIIGLATDITERQSPYLLSNCNNSDREFKKNHQENMLQNKSVPEEYRKNNNENFSIDYNENFEHNTFSECNEEILEEYYTLIKD